jgi:hypothetical protein
LCRILNCRVEDIITYVPDKTAAASSLDAVAEQEETSYENNK